MDFILRMVNAGYRDIVVAAPTGVGKTGIGLAACLWAALDSVTKLLQARPGGYYLVSQKLLQDQISGDFERFRPQFAETGVTLKSAVEYPCPSHIDCKTGHAATTQWLKQAKTDGPGPVSPEDPKALRPCPNLVVIDPTNGAYTRGGCERCEYDSKKRQFVQRPIGVTNYAYWLSERQFVGQFPKKNVLILDECHGIEKQLLGFVELGISPKQIARFSKGVDNRKIDRQEDFAEWLEDEYAPAVKANHDATLEKALEQPHNRRLQADLQAVENHVSRMGMALDGLNNHPENWVYWCEQEDKGYRYILKPLDAAPYFKRLMLDCPLRVYMSAYPGPKNLFCSTLGLDQMKVAWKNLESTFPVEHRPVHIVLVGSMGRAAYEETLPRLLYTTTQILDRHANQKGLIHCFDRKTRLYTKRGFIFAAEINKNDYLMTLNTNTGGIEWQQPVKIVKRFHSGPVICVKNRSVDFCVTPEHLVYTAPGKNGIKTMLLAAGSLIGGRQVFGRKKARIFNVPRTGKWTGVDFTLGPLRGVKGAAFLGWFLSEGCAYETRWHRQFQRIVSIAQQNILETPIPKLCRENGFHPYVCPSYPHQLTIQHKSLWTILRASCYKAGFGSHYKAAPLEIKNASIECIQACLNTLIAGDGSRSKNNGNRCGQPHAYLCTTSWQLCQDVIELAVKCGYSAVYRLVDRKRWKPSVLRGRTIKGGKIFVVEVGFAGQRARFRSSELTRRSYHGYVACPVTRNGIIFAERNGKTYWSGNCHSYKLGKAIYEHLLTTPHAARVLFPETARDRAGLFRRHCNTEEPTVLLSPSMTEGFSLDDDLSRFQIITKIPFPFLGDKQICAKKDRDPDWYTLQAVMGIVQSSGRSIRNDKDFAETYILDRDFYRIYNDDCLHFWPSWFQRAFNWVQK